MIDLKEIIASKIAKFIDLPLDEIKLSIEVPKNTEFGDYAFACFKLAKTYKKAPNLISQELADKLTADLEDVSSVDSAKNADVEIFDSFSAMGGYMNIKLKSSIFAQILFDEFSKCSISCANDKDPSLNSCGTNLGMLEYGASNRGNGKNIIVEFSSANIAKPFHIGHLRSTAIGNALYRMYKYKGFNTIAINHLGDYGTQFGKLIVAYRKWGDIDKIKANPIPELLSLYVKFHEEAENAPSLNDEARAVFKALEDGKPDVVELWQWIKDLSLDEFNRVYKLMGVEFDSYNGEAFYSDKMDIVIDKLNEKNLLMDSQGAKIVDLSEFDMPPALITKSDGSTIYMTRDLAAALYRKKTYEFDKNIYVVAYQQDLHFKQWFKVLELMGYEWARDCIHVNFGMISLPDGAIKTRTGNVVFLEDVLNTAIDKVKDVIEVKNPNLPNKDEIAKQVGVGAIIFQDLFNLRIKDYTFEWEKALTFEGESGPYVQYTHARACTLIEKSGITPNYDVDAKLLNDQASVDLAKILLNFSDVVDEALNTNEPSKVTRYCVLVAQAFNKFYQENQINSLEDETLKMARLALVDATRFVIQKALYLIGLQAPTKM